MTGWVAHHTDGADYLRRRGDGPTLMLLHGIGSNAHSFEPLVPHLSAQLDLIAWNAPGYGASDPLSMAWPVAADYAARLEALLNALKIGSCILLGHSLGALMAAAFAVRWPDRVTALLLAAPALGHSVTPGEPLSGPAQLRIDELQELGPAQFAKKRAPRLLADPSKAAALEAVEAAMAEVRLPGYAQAVRMLASGRLLDDAQKLAIPTHIVVGAQDAVTPPDGARALFDHLPDTALRSLTIAPDAGHALYIEAPGAVAAAMSATIDQTSAQRANPSAPKEVHYV